MFALKHLKMLQHVSIIIQIIFRELVCSLLKSLILKFFKSVKSQCGDAAASPHWLFIIWIYINSTNIPPIMIINRLHEYQNLLSLKLVSFLVELRTYQHLCRYRGADKSLARPTSRCILFDGENISFDATLFIYTGLFISPWNILKIRNK